MKKKRSHARTGDQTTITLSVPIAVKKELVKYAQENDLDVSKAIRKIIREKGPEYGIKPEES